MRHPLLLTGLLLLPAAAHAQVTIDLRALEALPQAPPPPTKPAARPVLRTIPAAPATEATLPVPPVPPSATPAPAPATAPAAANQSMASTPPAHPAAPAPASTPASASQATASAGPTPPSAPAPPAAPASSVPPPATLPAAPPALASLAPIPPPVAPAPAKPPAPPPVSATAGTTAKPENTGLRLEFKPDQSDLSPAADSAIGELVKTTPNGATVTFNIVAYAAGAVDDPSVARRMSLARGLSVRAALITAGVPSTRIYVRALGAGAADGPPDRVDLTVLGISGATAAAKP